VVGKVDIIQENFNQLYSNLSSTKLTLDSIKEKQDLVVNKINKLESNGLPFMDETLLTHTNQIAAIEATANKALEATETLTQSLASKIQETNSQVTKTANELSSLSTAFTTANTSGKLQQFMDEMTHSLSTHRADMTTKLYETTNLTSTTVATISSQITDLSSTVAESTNAQDNALKAWKINLDKEWIVQKQQLESKVDKLEGLVHAQSVSLAAMEAQLQAQKEEVQFLRLQREKDRDNAIKEKTANAGCASLEAVEQLRSMLWQLQSGLAAQSSRAVELLLLNYPVTVSPSKPNPNENEVVDKP